MTNKVIQITDGPAVTVDGKVYPTEIVDGVQRFVENKAVSWFVDQATWLNPDEPDPIKRGTIDPKSKANLNTLALAYHLQTKFTKREYMEFLMMLGYSVCGFADAVPKAEISNPLWREDRQNGQH
jgi:hypothetical protein